MTDTFDQSRLLSRARLLSRLALVLAFLILILALGSALPSFADILRPVTAPDREAAVTARLLKFIDSVMHSGITSAFTLCALALIVPAAVRLASSGTRPSWAVAQDPVFARDAARFASIAVAFAWVYFVVNLASQVHVQYNVFASLPFGGSEVATPFSDVAMMLATLVRALTKSLAYLFQILLAAYLLRALLVLSADKDAPQVASREGGQDE